MMKKCAVKIEFEKKTEKEFDGEICILLQTFGSSTGALFMLLDQTVDG